MKYALPTITIVGLLFSCAKTETTNQTQDSVSSGTVTVSLEPPTPVYNPADSGTFKGFIDFCKTSDTQLPEWAVSFITENNIGHFTTNQVLTTEPFYWLVYEQFVPVGPGVDELHAISFSKDGTFISDTKLGESYPSSGPNGGGSEFSYSYSADRKVIHMTIRLTDWNDEKQEEFTTETWFPYHLDENGNVIPGRQYPEMSKLTLDESSLSMYTKDELKIMRNEIFAVYGHIFKTEPLKSHFSAIPWYVPERENVDEMLTDLEKANVALIKKVEEQKVD